MDLAGVERRLFASAGGNLHRASWNPVRLSHHGTVEIRSMAANFPEMVLAVSVLIRGAAESVRRERLEVRPGRGVLALEPEGDLLHVPVFSYLKGALLAAAATRGVLDRRVESYVDSVVSFASSYLERPELVEVLGSSGSYKTTECEILASCRDRDASLTREQGLSLVRKACRRLEEQVDSLHDPYDGISRADESASGVANVIVIRDPPSIAAEGARMSSVDEVQASAGVREEGPA
jgi:carboxylate-amine ligase